MTRPSRRALLGSTAGLLALTAGCIADDDDETDPGSDPGTDDGESDDGSGNGNGNGNESENGSDDDGDGNGDGDDNDNGDDDGATDDELTTETQQYQHPAVSDEPTTDLLADHDDADDWLAERDLTDDDEVTQFVDETEFDDSILVAIEGGAPNLCHEMAIDSAELEDDTLAIEAAVSDEATAEQACADQEVTVGAVVRATFADEPTTDLSVTVVDRDGTAHGMASASDSATDSDE